MEIDHSSDLVRTFLAYFVDIVPSRWWVPPLLAFAQVGRALIVGFGAGVGVAVGGLPPPDAAAAAIQARTAAAMTAATTTTAC